MPSKKGMPDALVTALLAAGLAGSKAIDGLNRRPDEDNPKEAIERPSFGSRNQMPPSREVVSWALKQLSDLASDRDT